MILVTLFVARKAILLQELIISRGKALYACYYTVKLFL